MMAQNLLQHVLSGGYLILLSNFCKTCGHLVKTSKTLVLEEKYMKLLRYMYSSSQ